MLSTLEAWLILFVGRVPKDSNLDPHHLSPEPPANSNLGCSLLSVDPVPRLARRVVVVGGGTILATNMAQIVDSAGASPHLVAALVSLFSIGNLLGRLLLM